jgi:hypothetical protein
MKAIMLYRPNSESSRIVEEYARDFERTRGRTIKLISLNTREGAAIASLYDMMDNPGLIVLRDDGQVVMEWQGTKLPLMNEVAGYLG